MTSFAKRISMIFASFLKLSSTAPIDPTFAKTTVKCRLRLPNRAAMQNKECKNLLNKGKSTTLTFLATTTVVYLRRTVEN